MTFDPLGKEVEQRVLALLAQSMPYSDIIDQIQLDYQRPISTRSIIRIKGRNLQLVTDLRMTIAEHQNATADTILKKTHAMLSQSLTIAQEAAVRLHELRTQYDGGQISTEEYFTLVKDIKLPTITELAGVSKAMFDQTKEGRTPPPQLPATDLSALLGETDEIKLSQVIFSKTQTKTESVPINTPSE